MLAIIGSSSLADGLAGFFAPQRRVLRVASPDGGSAEARLAALGTIAGSGVALAVAATGEDERSLIAAAAAKAHGAPRTAAIVESRALAAGGPLAPAVDRLIEPDTEFARAVASLALGPIAAAVRSLGPDRIRVAELTIAPDWRGAGKSLRGLGLPAGSRVALIRRGEWAIAPSAGAVLKAGDRVLLVANRAVASDAAAKLGAGSGAGPRALVLGRDAGRAALIARLMSEAEVAAQALDPDEPALPRPCGAVEFVVLLDAEPGDVDSARSAAPAARIVASALPGARAAKGAAGTPTPGMAVLTPLEAVAGALADLLPRPAVERVGTIAPGELDVYRAEAGDSGRWLGVPLRELAALRGWTVLAIRAGRGVHLPHPEDAVAPREILILAGPPGAEEVLARGLRGG